MLKMCRFTPLAFLEAHLAVTFWAAQAAARRYAPSEIGVDRDPIVVSPKFAFMKGHVANVLPDSISRRCEE